MLLHTVLTRQNYGASGVVDTKLEFSLAQESICADESKNGLNTGK
jgi:hypothetical protein